MLTLTINELRQIDYTAEKVFSMPSLLLMENAGRGCTDYIHLLTEKNKRILILCGKGNNGGDGMVVARQLLVRGYSPEICLVDDPDTFSRDCEINYKICKAISIPFVQSIANYDVYIDAIFGTGFHGSMPDKISSLLRQINMYDALKVAIDIPSGLEADTGCYAADVFRADYTLAIFASKLCFDARYEITGKVSIVDLGLPQNIYHYIDVGRKTDGFC